jgi:hypothetical protein
MCNTQSRVLPVGFDLLLTSLLFSQVVSWPLCVLGKINGIQCVQPIKINGLLNVEAEQIG